MTTFQIIGLIVVALLGLYVFYCIYDLGKFNKKKDKRHSKNKALTLALLFLALTIGQNAWAQVSSYSVSTSTTNNVTTFTVTRSGNLDQAETVFWRIVSVSAMEGIHYTCPANYSGTFNFAANEYEKSITVTEKTSANVNERYRYQTGTSRYYRFEVLDQGGFELASKNRTIDYGDSYKFNKSKVNKSITNMVYFNNSAYTTPMSSSKYMDVYFTPPTGWVESSGTLQGYVLIDDSYDYAQKPATVSTANLINATNATGSYLSTVGIKLYTTLCFTEKEKDDGYAYVQIIAGDANASYDGKDPDGKVDTPSNSVYKACFELYNSGGTVYSGNGKQFYPHRYDYKNRSAGGQTADHTEFYLFDSYLWEQEFKSSSYRAANSGSVVLSPAFTNLTARFDANGSGDDTFGYKDLFFRMALCDTEAPYVLRTANLSTVLGSIVSGSRHCKGNYIYVTLPFNEIVEVTGTPTLSSNWGTLSYYSGTGTNVITFRGNISSSASGTFAVDGFSGTIKDLVGNEFAGYVSKTFTGTTLTADYTYHVDYDLAGGSVSSANPTTYNWSTATITLNNPTKTYYDFAGWTGSNGSTPQTTVKINTHSHGDRSYTANWTLTNYSIAYDLAGGILPEGQSNPATYTVQTPTFTLVNPTREGYVFSGWTGTGISQPTQTVTVTQGTSGGLSYTANWSVEPWAGDGTQDHPYTIVNTDQLDLLATRVNSASGDEYAASGYEGIYFKLEANITYNTEGLGNTDENFTAIGGYYDNAFRCFKGTFDGNNKTISGIRIHKSGTDNADNGQAVFGRLDHATVTNIILNNVRITGNNEIGGIAGYANESTIENCIVRNATLTATQTNGDCGVITGTTMATTYDANYYRNCTVNGTANAVNVGVQGADCDGARSVHTLTLGQDILAAGESVVINNATYYASNTTVTLSYDKSIDAGYRVVYSYDDGTPHAIDGNTFTMPAVNTTVSFTIVPIVYSISYNLVNGTMPEGESNPETYTVETPTFTLVNPKKANQVFVGWTGTDLTEATPTVTIVQGSIGDRDYTANWQSENEACLISVFPWTENFDSYAIGIFDETCWVNEHISGEGTDRFCVDNPYAAGNDTRLLKLPDMEAGTLTKLVLPEMVLPSNDYEFTIDVYRSSYIYGDYPYQLEGIRVYASIDGNIEGATELAFIPRHYQVSSGIIPAEQEVDWYNYEIPIGMKGTCYIILRGESQFCTSTYMDNFAVKAIPTCFKPDGLTCTDITSHTATLNWTSDAEAWQICLNDDEDHLIDVTENPCTLTGLDDQTTYTVKVRTNCGNADYSDWSRSTIFTTPIACAAPTDLTVSEITGHQAKLNWNGDSDGYVVNYRTASYAIGIYEEFNTTDVPDGWTKHLGFVDDVLADSTQLLSDGRWSISSQALGDYNMKLNIYGASCRSWLVSPEFMPDQNLSFDLALTDFNNEDPIESDTLQDDDRFIVLIYADNAWTILREWNNSGSEYVFNDIATTGEHITIDLSAYYGQEVKIAFYGESRVSGGDNDIHIDNVICGTMIPAGEWQSLNTNNTHYTLTGLIPEIHYEVFVKSDCPNETGHATGTIGFTTDVACHVPYDVTVSDVTCNSATVTWAGYSDSYILTWSLGEGHNIVTYDFEDNAIPDDMVNISDYPWTVTDTLANGGYCMRSDNAGMAGSTSEISIVKTYPSAGFIEFDAECRGEGTGTAWDRCVFYIDGDIALKVGNLSDSGWLHYRFPVTEGEHTFSWAYIKDNSVNPLGDYFAVDNIEMYSETLIPQDPVNTTDNTYTFNGLLPLNWYYVQVKGVCEDVPTEDSDTLSFKTLSVGITVEGYGDDPNSEGGWAFIATPMLAGNAPDEVANLLANPVQNYDLYRLNPSTSMWENYKNTEEHPDFTTMVNGRGYLYSNKNDVSLNFTGTLNTDDFMEIDLEQGWNLVGNPFAAPAYIDRLYYKMNDEGSDIEAVENYQETAIPMCTSVLVRATAPDQKVVFTRSFESSTGNNGGLQLTLSQAVTTRAGVSLQTADKAIVSFNEDAQLVKYIFNDRTAKLYFTQDGEDYAITYTDGVGEMPLNFKAKKNGEYTITVNCEAKHPVHLIDNLTGVDVDLLQTPSYTFTARNDDYPSRFKLVFGNENDNENEDFAFISNGNIIVNGQGTVQVIDMLGRQLFSRQASSGFRLPTSVFTPGVYVLRLINGNEIKTQKIIIK